MIRLIAFKIRVILYFKNKMYVQYIHILLYGSRASSASFSQRSVVVGTGYCPLDTYAVKLKILEDATCQSWRKEDKVESSLQFLLCCSAYTKLRLTHFDCHIFTNPAMWLELILAASINLW